MDDTQEVVQILANLDALPGNPTDEQVLQATKGFRNVSVLVALYQAIQAAGAGGGGGSGTANRNYTFTAAEVAQDWDSDQNQVAIEITDIGDGVPVWSVLEIANTLDQTVFLPAGSPLYAYLAGQTSADVLLSGEVVQLGNNGVSLGTYVASDSQTTISPTWLLPDAGHFYVAFTGDAAPTTGSITVRVSIA